MSRGSGFATPPDVSGHYPTVRVFRSAAVVMSLPSRGAAKVERLHRGIAFSAATDQLTVNFEIARPDAPIWNGRVPSWMPQRLRNAFHKAGRILESRREPVMSMFAHTMACVSKVMATSAAGRLRRGSKPSIQLFGCVGSRHRTAPPMRGQLLKLLHQMLSGAQR